jgi:hypothetical protein
LQQQYCQEGQQEQLPWWQGTNNGCGGSKNNSSCTRLSGPVTRQQIDGIFATLAALAPNVLAVAIAIIQPSTY